MSQAPQPTLDEIRRILSELAHRVVTEREPSLDAVTRGGIQRTLVELRRFIPGLDPPPHPAAAEHLAAAAAASLLQGCPRIALGRALRGLTFAPHHAELHYLAASACFELAAASEALALLAHAAWINPGHERARRELEALAAFGREPEVWPEGGEERDDMDPAA